MSAGLYEIHNISNGKFYGGSTVNLQKRWDHHKSDLRLNKHRNQHLQRAWNKYGETVFIYKKILICANEDILFYEQRWLDKYVETEKCYNIAKSSSAPMLGRKCKTKGKKCPKISASKLGKKPMLTEKRIAFYKRQTGKKRIFTEIHKQKLKDTQQRNSKIWIGFIAPNGTIYRNIFNLNKFSKEHNLHVAAMHRIAMGTQFTHKGWTLIDT